MVRSTLVVALILGSSFAVAAPKAAKPPVKQIVCNEDSGELGDGDARIGTYTITFDAKGSPVKIQINRIEEDELPAIKQVLIPKTTKITHTVRKNAVESIEDGKPVYSFGIEDVEVIKAEYKGGALELIINDHNYSGTVGSTVNLQVGKLSFTSLNINTVFCQGDVKFPRESGGMNLEGIED